MDQHELESQRKCQEAIKAMHRFTFFEFFVVMCFALIAISAVTTMFTFPKELRGGIFPYIEKLRSEYHSRNLETEKHFDSVTENLINQMKELEETCLSRESYSVGPQIGHPHGSGQSDYLSY